MLTLSANLFDDIYLAPSGNLSLSRDLDAVQQCCITAMLTLLGEMILAMNEGVAYRTTVWDTYNAAAFESSARTRLLGVANVLAVNDFQITIDGDNLNYQATIATAYGETVVNSL